MKAFLVSFFVVCALSATAAPVDVSMGLTCAEQFVLRGALDKYLIVRDKELRDKAPYIGELLVYNTQIFAPVLALHTGGDARVVVSVNFQSETNVLKQFYERNSWITYVAGIQNLREAGIPTVAVLDSDPVSMMARLRYEPFISPYWTELEIPRDLRFKIANRLYAVTKQINRLAWAARIINRDIQDTNVLLNIDENAFKVIDVE